MMIIINIMKIMNYNDHKLMIINMTKMMIITTTLMIRRWTTTSPPPYLQPAGTHCLFRQGGFIDHNPHDDQFCHMIIMQGPTASLLHNAFDPDDLS